MLSRTKGTTQIDVTILPGRHAHTARPPDRFVEQWATGLG